MPTCICKNMLQDHRKYGSITGSVLDSPMLHEKVVEVLCESNRHNKNVMLQNALLTNQQKNLFQVKKKNKIKIKKKFWFSAYHCISPKCSFTHMASVGMCPLDSGDSSTPLYNHAGTQTADLQNMFLFTV